MARPSLIRRLSLRAGPALQLRQNTTLSSRHLAYFYTTSHRTLSQPLQQQGQIRLPSTQKRTFLSSFIPSPPSPNNNNNGNSTSRTLTATRTLPYPPQPLFRVISSVESYSDFLPFLTSSTVTARDPETNYPTRAYLTVGYGPLSETFTSKVDCDPRKWVVEARSGERFRDATAGRTGGNGVSTGGLSSGLGALAGFAGFPGADEGIFEYLSTRWELVPEGESSTIASTGSGVPPKTTVNLEIRFEFKNQMYAKMMGAVEGQMAGIMIEAFEKRIREVHR